MSIHGKNEAVLLLRAVEACEPGEELVIKAPTRTFGWIVSIGSEGATGFHCRGGAITSSDLTDALEGLLERVAL